MNNPTDTNQASEQPKDLMEHQFDRYNKLNFGSYKFMWQKWIIK